MASAVDCGDEEMQILEAPESNVTLNDAERMELIAVITLSLSTFLSSSSQSTKQINKVLTPPPTTSFGRHLCLHGLDACCLDTENVASRVA